MLAVSSSLPAGSLVVSTVVKPINAYASSTVHDVLLPALPCSTCSGVINTPEGSDDEALRKLFMRIDANCDAAVDW